MIKKENDKKKTTEDVKKEDKFHLMTKPKVIKELIGLVNPLVNEAKLKIKPDGIQIIATDPAHVAMVDLTLKSKAFEEYEATETEIGIDLDKMSELLKLPANSIIIDYDPKTNRLIIKLDEIIRRFGLIDTAGLPDQKVPTLDLPAKVIMEEAKLSKSIRACEQISDHLRLTASKDKFVIYAEGDVDTVEIPLAKDMLIELEATEEYSSLFSLDYMNSITKSAKEQITLNIGNDNPMMMEYTFSEGAGNVAYLLAPRIESE